MLTPMTDDVVTVVNSPTILVSMGLVEKGEKWVLTHAMYGLRQSPRLLSSFRDGHLRRLVGSWEGKDLKFVQGEVEPNLWATMAEDSICGALLVYVDDLLICGSSSLIEYVAKMVSELWETTKLEMATLANPLRFLGCEIHDLKPGFAIDQLPYIKELLRAHGTPPAQLNDVPCPREWLVGDHDQAVDIPGRDSPGAENDRGAMWITRLLQAPRKHTPCPSHQGFKSQARTCTRQLLPALLHRYPRMHAPATCGEDRSKGAWLLAAHRGDSSGVEANSSGPDGLFGCLLCFYRGSPTYGVFDLAAQLPRGMALWEASLHCVEQCRE